MALIEGDREAQQDATLPPTVGLWRAIAETPKALEILSKGKKGTTRRIIVERYLATPTTSRELETVVGTSGAAISTMVSRTVKKVFPYLPEQVRTAYGSPEQALKERTAFMIASGNARRAQAIEAGTYTGKPLGRRLGSGRRG